MKFQNLNHETYISETDRFKFEKDSHNSPTLNYRIRCKFILLKSTGKSASEFTEIFDVTGPTVYAWIKCYKENSIKDLETYAGSGMKDCSDDEAVCKELQRGASERINSTRILEKLPAKKSETLPSNVFGSIGASYK